jgi:hypothetical protein
MRGVFIGSSDVKVNSADALEGREACGEEVAEEVANLRRCR